MNKITALLFFGLLLTFIQCKKNPAIQQEVKKEPIYSMENAYDFQYEAMEYYNKDARRAVNAFQKAAEAYVQNGNKKDAGICLSNAARLYEDEFANIDSAMILAQRGLDYSIEANDTLNKGHGYRYTGFLIGISSTNLAEAKTRIDKSKEFYMMRNFADAVAVADYDLARVYYKQKMYEEAHQSLMKSTNYFKERQLMPRIFNNNLFALRLYKESNKPQLYQQAKSENEALMGNDKITDILKNKFKEIVNRN